MSEDIETGLRAINALGPLPLTGDRLTAMIAAKASAREGLEALRQLPLRFANAIEPGHATHRLSNHPREAERP